MGNLLRFVGQSFNANSGKWLLFGAILTVTHLALMVPFLGMLVVVLVMPWLQMGAATFLSRAEGFQSAGTSIAPTESEVLDASLEPERNVSFSDFFAAVHQAPGLISLTLLNGLVFLGLIGLQAALYARDPALMDALLELVGMQAEYVALSTEAQMKVMTELGLFDLLYAHIYETLALLLIAVVWMGMTFTAPYRLVLEGRGLGPALAQSFRDGSSHWWLPLWVGIRELLVLQGIASGWFILPILLPLLLIFSFGLYRHISRKTKENELAHF